MKISVQADMMEDGEEAQELSARTESRKISATDPKQLEPRGISAPEINVLPVVSGEVEANHSNASIRGLENGPRSAPVGGRRYAESPPAVFGTTTGEGVDGVADLIALGKLVIDGLTAMPKATAAVRPLHWAVDRKFENERLNARRTGSRAVVADSLEPEQLWVAAISSQGEVTIDQLRIAAEKEKEVTTVASYSGSLGCTDSPPVASLWWRLPASSPALPDRVLLVLCEDGTCVRVSPSAAACGTCDLNGFIDAIPSAARQFGSPRRKFFAMQQLWSDMVAVVYDECHLLLISSDQLLSQLQVFQRERGRERRGSDNSGEAEIRPSPSYVIEVKDSKCVRFVLIARNFCQLHPSLFRSVLSQPPPSKVFEFAANALGIDRENEFFEDLAMIQAEPWIESVIRKQNDLVTNLSAYGPYRKTSDNSADELLQSMRQTSFPRPSRTGPLAEEATVQSARPRNEIDVMHDRLVAFGGAPYLSFCTFVEKSIRSTGIRNRIVGRLGFIWRSGPEADSASPPESPHKLEAQPRLSFLSAMFGEHVVQEVVICPWQNDLALCRDNLARICLMQISNQRVIHWWKGYRRGHMTWARTNGGCGNDNSGAEILNASLHFAGGKRSLTYAIFLAPLRGLVEFWRIRLPCGIERLRAETIAKHSTFVSWPLEWKAAVVNPVTLIAEPDVARGTHALRVYPWKNLPILLGEDIPASV